MLYRFTCVTHAARLVSGGRTQLEDETDPGNLLQPQPLRFPALCESDEESLQGTVRRLVDKKRPALLGDNFHLGALSAKDRQTVVESFLRAVVLAVPGAR